MEPSETKSLLSPLSKSQMSKGSSLVKDSLSYKKWGLHERCSPSDMLKFKEKFEDAYMGKLTQGEFRSLIRSITTMEYDDDEFHVLFLKINTNRDGMVEWDEFVSHLLLGYFENDPDNQRETLTLPIMGFPRILKSHHRHTISRICFCPDVSKDRQTNCMQGTYITASRDGMVNWWSLDMSLLRTAYSTCPYLKVQSTWVTDMVCMPDVNIIVTSSTERDLRFYDCTAQTFTLKLIISSWDSMICTMHYYFHKDTNENNILILGDVGGNVRVLLFTPVLRGPFQNKPGKALVQIRHVDLIKNCMPELKLVEFKNVHTDWVRQVSYYSSLHCIVSCSTCPDALLMCDIAGSKTHNIFHITKGIHCFAFEEEKHALVTGGPDCTVRFWNPFVPTKPIIIFQGHHAGIVSIVLQNDATRIYSLSRDRVIKVWDVHAQVCLQTYIDIPPEIGERTPLSIAYNPGTREMIIASLKIATVILDELLNPDHTDGSTHSKGVSKVLYNPLFKIVVTCGMDSIIICWDPISGKRMAMVREAHTRLLHGELIPVEITAACFDPGYQLLLTGARNGTLKVWNFNTGICLRNMAIEHMCEVTMVTWVEGRILAVGWNRHVTEFEDSGTAVHGKSWESRHEDDVLAAAARTPTTLVTSSYSSELIMWKLETGQPYRRFSCMDPTTRIKMHYSKRDIQKTIAASSSTGKKRLSFKRASVIGGSKEVAVEMSNAIEKARARRVSVVSMPARAQLVRKLAVHAMIFLETRPFDRHFGSLLLSLENGSIQFWSDHPAGGYKGSFQGIHTAGDYVTSFATDVENMYLITGTTVGYIKIWLMQNYMTGADIVHVNMPKLRVQFPFMWKDRIEGRAKRSVRDQPLPILLSSYRGHMRCITSLAFIDERKFVISGSSDQSVRMWKLSGEYLHTLGTFLPWSLEGGRYPPDVRKVASFTSFKVWNKGEVSRYVPGQPIIDLYKDITETELRTKTYGEQATEPLLGQYFKLPKRPDRQDRIILDDTLQTIPLYTHLRMAPRHTVRRPPTPELVKLTRLKRDTLKVRTNKLQFQTPSDKKDADAE